MSIPFISIDVFDIISINALYIIFCNLMNIKSINNVFLQIFIKISPSTKGRDLLISYKIDAQKLLKDCALSDLSIKESWVYKLSGIVYLLFSFIKV